MALKSKSSSLRSMTGFGSCSLTDGNFSVFVQIKTVNSRFLEIRLKAPSEYSALESELKRMITQSLSRGSVEVYIQRTQGSLEADHKITVNTGLAKAWMSACTELQKDLKLSDSAFTRLMFSGPDFVELAEKNDLDTTEVELLKKAVSEAIQKCVQHRESEGAVLKEHLSSLISSLDQVVQDIDSMRGPLQEKMLEKLRARILPKASQLGVEISEERLAQEIVILVDRADVEEEMARLKGHLVSVKELLKESGAVGKKLEFLVQELLREVNTTGSKIQDLEISSKVIEAKTILERLREQGQNIE